MPISGGTLPGGPWLDPPGSPCSALPGALLCSPYWTPSRQETWLPRSRSWSRTRPPPPSSTAPRAMESVPWLSAPRGCPGKSTTPRSPPPSRRKGFKSCSSSATCASSRGRFASAGATGASTSTPRCSRTLPVAWTPTSTPRSSPLVAGSPAARSTSSPKRWTAGPSSSRAGVRWRQMRPQSPSRPRSRPSRVPGSLRSSNSFGPATLDPQPPG
mmetsp:Transcript_14948/g.44299  ORF Transcript_14948/g.44299 Transcript_14948/m.44299 type:complete len:214 (-) Transcript_14948:1078-1719(-)